MTEKRLKKIDIFISSPGDVIEERKIASEIIEQLNSMPHIEDHYILKDLAYEKKVPAAIGETPQKTVDRYMIEADKADIFICIMWSRMGTPVKDSDGTEYHSGTEYEFTKAYKGNQKNGKPYILLYRSKKSISIEDADFNQVELVKAFFKKFEGKEAEFKGLYKKYENNEEFRKTLFQDINILISSNLIKPYSAGGARITANGEDPKDYDKLLDWHSKGFELYNAGKYDEAIPCFDKALEIDPGYILALAYKGESLSRLGMYGEAMLFFDKALEINPKYVYVLNSKGYILYLLKKYNDALLCFDKAIETEPGYIFPWYNRGRLLIDLERFDEADISLSKFIELWPESNDSTDAKNLLKLAKEKRKSTKRKAKAVSSTINGD